MFKQSEITWNQFLDKFRVSKSAKRCYFDTFICLKSWFWWMWELQNCPKSKLTISKVVKMITFETKLFGLQPLQRPSITFVENYVKSCRTLYSRRYSQKYNFQAKTIWPLAFMKSKISPMTWFHVLKFMIINFMYEIA